MKTIEWSRRQFVTTSAAAGLTIYLALHGSRREAPAAASFDPNLWLSITPDGRVTVHITKAEMGQGVGTALAQIVAEELEVDWRDVRIDYPVFDPKYGVTFTGGSWSVSTMFDRLARAGAQGRIMLVDAAARAWGVPAAEGVAERGVVRHRASGRSIAYGDIVARLPLTATLTEDDLKKIPLKKPTEYKIIGQSVPRLDIPEKTNGQAKYGIDVFLPGMVYAKIAYPPTRDGGKHTAVDDSAARQVKGWIRTVVAPSLVAVVADSYEAAVKARDALKVTWDLGRFANVSSASVLKDYEIKATQDPGVPWVSVGDVKAGLAQAARTHSAVYTTDFAVHAQLEPMNAVVHFHDGIYDLYTGTQVQTRVLTVLAKQLDVEPSRIRIHQQLLGGGFGRRLEEDIVLEATLIAREVGRPVKLIRSREEDLRRGFYRSLTYQAMRAGLDAQGRITAWEHTVVAGYPRRRRGGLDDKGRDPFALNGSDHVYDMPNQLVKAVDGESGIPVGYYRSVAPGYTFFAVETFLDELAHLVKLDPLQYRLAMLGKQPRLAEVLKRASVRGGWDTPLPANAGRGIACSTAQERKEPTYTAAVVQARVEPATGRVRVDKITCVTECGLIVNPDGALAQVESALLFGLSNALKEYGTVTRGAFDQGNFDQYHLLRMEDVPDLDIHFVRSAEKPTGLGEPGFTVVAPALSNAIFAATGARVRSIPFLPDRVRRAIQTKV